MVDYTKMSDDQLEAISKGERYKPSLMSRVGNFMGENAELPGSLVGGLAGAAAGTAVLPGVGTVIGGILGGAGGAFTGSLASDVYQDERLDFEDALKEGAISVGFDAATLGAGKLIKPIARSLGVNTGDLLMNMMGRGVDNSPPALTALPTNIAAGSQESLRLTQQLLEEGGGSLSALQTGQASFVRATAEEIGEIGLFSAGQTAKRIAANNDVLTREVQRLTDGIDPSLARLPEAVGEEIYGIVESGRRAAGQLYAEGLGKIAAEYGDRQLSPSRFRTALKQFNTDHASDFGDMMSKQTRSLVNELDERLFAVPSVKTTALFDLDKIIGNNIDQAMPGNQFADTKTVQQLSELRTRLRNAMDSTLEKQPKGLRDGYRALKKEYGDSMSDLLPKIGQSVIRAAKDGDFNRLGSLLIKQTNTGKINAFMRSIDRSYADIAKANVGKQGKDLIEPAVKTAEEAKSLVRQSFIQNTFKNVEGDTTDFKDIRRLALQLNQKEPLMRAKAIMGESFGDYRRLVNAIADSTVDGKRGLFSLAVRSKEISAAAKVGQITAGGAGAAGLVGLPVAAAILTIPSVLAKIATNKRAVNRLLALNSEVVRNTNITPDLVASGVAKALMELSDTDRQSLQREIGVKF